VGLPASLSVLKARTFRPASGNNPEVTPLYLSVYDLRTPAFALQCNVAGDCAVSCTVIPVAESEVQFRNRANHTATGPDISFYGFILLCRIPRSFAWLGLFRNE
jgi:hypothetical protein